MQLCLKKKKVEVRLERKREIGKGGDMEGRRRGHGTERERKAHSMNFKTKDNSVLIIHSLKIITVTLPSVSLKN